MAREFKGGDKMKFVRNKVEEDLSKISVTFHEQMNAMDHFGKFRTMLNEMKCDGRKWKGLRMFRGQMVEKKTITTELLSEWCEAFLRKLDETIVTKVSNEIKKMSVARTEICETVFNFSEKEVPAAILKKLSLGSNFAMHTRSDEREARTKLENELLLYLRKYRQYIENKSAIMDDDVGSWLERAIADSVVNSQHLKFYSEVNSCLTIDLGIARRVDGEKVDFKKLDEMDLCVVEADKGMGLVILDVKKLISADETMVDELGGVRCENKTCQDVLMDIKTKVNEFESKLGIHERKFLDTYYEERMNQVDQAMIPFLKLRPKLHKLKQQQLQERNCEELKFRPVVDASRGPLNEYSKSLMEYMRDLVRKVCMKFFQGEKPIIKNGQEVLEVLKSVGQISNNGKYFVVADLSSAYTYIFLENLLIAMKNIGAELDIPVWKKNMFENIAELVLGNSFLQTSAGVFLLGTCLPMGLNASGEAMDLVLLMSELVALGKIKHDLTEFEEQYEEYKGLKFENKCSLLSYRSFRDDTFSVFEKESEKSVKDALETLGSTFLPALTINMEISYFVGSFLDTVFFKRMSGIGFESTVRRKGLFPISYCHGTSNVPPSILKSILGGEILRHRRLTTNRILLKTNDECIITEIVSRGYKEEHVRKIVLDRIKVIEQEYNEKFERRTKRSLPRGLVYGAKTVYDQEWNTHFKLKMILKHSLPEGIRYLGLG